MDRTGLGRGGVKGWKKRGWGIACRSTQQPSFLPGHKPGAVCASARSVSLLLPLFPPSPSCSLLGVCAPLHPPHPCAPCCPCPCSLHRRGSTTALAAPASCLGGSQPAGCSRGARAGAEAVPVPCPRTRQPLPQQRRDNCDLVQGEGVRGWEIPECAPSCLRSHTRHCGDV